MQIVRRDFLRAATAGPLAVGIARPHLEAMAPERLRVGVIGHTGRGNYGHGLDTVWKSVQDTVLVAVADGHAGGLAAAQKRLEVRDGYLDYHEMLAKTRPDIVAVCPRHPDQHLDMVLASIEAGARGILVEKPLCRTPAEADEMLSACRKHQVKLAVAHRNRYHPVVHVVRQMIQRGDLGKILELRGRGKGDRRGGAEDLWVLGSHVLNLFHFFAGDPAACSAVLLAKGHRAERDDVVEGNEALGPLAGDELHARYRFSSGWVGYFDSVANDQTGNAGFGLQVLGSSGRTVLRCDREPLAFWIPGNPFEPPRKARMWIPISSAGPGKPELDVQLIEDVRRQIAVARDLVAAVWEDRAPLCDVRQGAMTVEMICACFASHCSHSAEVKIPLAERCHPLTKWRMAASE